MKSLKFEKILPRYAWIPALTLLAVNMIAYFGTRIFTQGLTHHDISLPADHILPFVPAMISIYILAYVQWIAGYIMIGRESRELCYHMYTGEMLAKLMCMFCFVVYPTTLVRPEITGTGIFDSLTKLIYELDAPDNLFPSIHCLESYVCFRGALKIKKAPGWYRWVMLVMTLLVFASTVLVKQHVVVDMFGAVLVAELGFFLSGKFHMERIFKRRKQ